MRAISICPGCKVALPASGLRLDRKVNASAECWQVYGEVSGFELRHLVELGRLHQLTVDAYGAQHAGEQASRLGVAYSLVGLLLALARGAAGDEVRNIHQGMGRPDASWPHFDPPPYPGEVTVLDVAEAGARAGSVGGHLEAIDRWAKSVWHAWSDQHDQVALLADRILAQRAERRA